MEKAGPDIARCFNHGRDPGRIAARSNILALSEVSTEVLHNAPQLFGAFNHEWRFAIGSLFVDLMFVDGLSEDALFEDELFNLNFQRVDLVRAQADPVTAFRKPALGTVKRFGSQIRSQKRH